MIKLLYVFSLIICLCNFGFTQPVGLGESGILPEDGKNIIYGAIVCQIDGEYLVCRDRFPEPVCKIRIDSKDDESEMAICMKNIVEMASWEANIYHTHDNPPALPDKSKILSLLPDKINSFTAIGEPNIYGNTTSLFLTKSYKNNQDNIININVNAYEGSTQPYALLGIQRADMCIDNDLVEQSYENIQGFKSYVYLCGETPVGLKIYLSQKNGMNYVVDVVNHDDALDSTPIIPIEEIYNIANKLNLKDLSNY